MASAAPPAPQVQVTQPTPRNEKPEFMDSETLSSYKQAGDYETPHEYHVSYHNPRFQSTRLA